VQRQQVLVFDAGSSGTRVHVFDMWLPEDPPRAHVPVFDLKVRDKQTKKVKPGLSSFAARMDLDGCQKNIEELLAFASQFVPKERRSSTPALLKATAGLRAQPAEKASAVLRTVRQTLASSGYKFEDSWADIIKGKEEGGLAWVAANYLHGTFAAECLQNKVGNGGTSGSVVGPSHCKVKGQRDTLGVIEMGGGSTQVTFKVSDDDTVTESDLFVFETARNEKYTLYAHSYLGYGQDYAQDTVRASIPADEAEDPCYPSGYVRRQALKATVEGQTSPLKLVHGRGDKLKCQEHIDQALLPKLDAPGRYTSELPLRGQFIATENFFYTQNDLSLSLDGNFIDPDVLEAAAAWACKRPYGATDSDVSAMATGKSNPNTPNWCFGMIYQARLLYALKVPVGAAEGEVKVRIAHQINGGDVDWALGAALVHYLAELKAEGGWEPHSTSGALGWYVLVLMGVGVVPLLSKSSLGVRFREEVLPKVFPQGMDGLKIGQSRSVAPATKFGQSTAGVE